MKKELDYFMIDGEFGGNQDWFTNIVMNVGGCGAATACDSCIYLAKYKAITSVLTSVPFSRSLNNFSNMFLFSSLYSQKIR
mgnify:CR=1 FL=1